MHISFIQYLLTGVCIVTAINLFLIDKLKYINAFNALLGWFSYYLGFHAFYIIFTQHFFSNMSWLDQYAPFGLMYGPFLYFAFICIHQNKISIKQVLLHSFLFLIFVGIFLYISLFSPPNSFLFSYYKVLNFLTASSFSLYTIIAIFFSNKPFGHQFRQGKLVILGAIIMLLFVSIIAITAVFSKQQVLSKPTAVELLKLLVYGCMFISAVIIFKYEINIVFSRVDKASEMVKIDKIIATPSTPDQQAKYEKSTLTKKQLDEYSKKLEKLMFMHKVYLSTDLSLKNLAQLMRIPNHHLTQVLSLKIKMRFCDYINRFRVQYACMLLEDEKRNSNLENIAERSGFNSKVSFNRHFKSVMGCTPSSYRANQGGSIK